MAQATTFHTTPIKSVKGKVVIRHHHNSPTHYIHYYNSTTTTLVYPAQTNENPVLKTKREHYIVPTIPLTGHASNYNKIEPLISGHSSKRRAEQTFFPSGLVHWASQTTPT